jgi:hypothetical protein
VREVCHGDDLEVVADRGEHRVAREVDPLDIAAQCAVG